MKEYDGKRKKNHKMQLYLEQMWNNEKFSSKLSLGEEESIYDGGSDRQCGWNNPGCP